MSSKLFQKVILFTIEAYLDDINPKDTYNYPFMLKIRTAIRGYLVWHKMSPEEADKVISTGKHEFMEKLTHQQIDRTIYALELLYLYIKEIPKRERANLNISDEKIKLAKAGLVTDVLKLKHKNTETGARIKEIVKESRVTAKQYYAYLEENLK